MADFDALNRQTREYNSRVHESYNRSQDGQRRPFTEYWQNQYNNQTFKANNGQFSAHYN